MARKIKFALEMANGVKVRSNLEELRENFDIDKAVGHFLSGKLVEWLEDRYYEDEAEKISALDKDLSDFREKLCDALGVDYESGEETDVEFLERLNEKKNYLRQKTDEKSIVANADKTALNQEDLSDLLDMEEPTIYLCGESFNIPIRVEKKKYIGILGAPKITIKANSQAELDAKNISFENCILPFAVETVAKVSVEKSATKVLHIKHTPYIPRKRLLKVFKNIATSASLSCWYDTWDFSFDDEKVQKKLALQKIFGGEYSEKDLIYISLDKDYPTKIPGFKSGWGLTIDSFCHGSLDGTFEIIKFEDVKSFDKVKSDARFSTSYNLMIETKDGQKHDCKECSGSNSYGDVAFMTRFLKEIAETRKYLEMAGELEEKNFEDLVSLDKLKEIFKNVFGYDAESSVFEVYNLMDRQDEDELTEEKKKNILKAICEDKYSEKDLIHIAGKLKFGGDWLGFALTKNSICFAGDSEKIIVPYDEIEVFKNNFELNTPFNDESFFDISKKYVYSFKWGEKDYRNYKEIAKSKENAGLNVFGNNLDRINKYLEKVGELLKKSHK